MDKTTIILCIISLICIISMILLYIKFNNISDQIEENKKIVDTHILNDSNELPSEISLDKLKVKNLEVENNLITSNINSNNDTISIDKNLDINKELNINGNKLKVNPKLTLSTIYDYKSDLNNDKFKNNKPQILYVDDTDDSNMKLNLNLDEIIYVFGNNYKQLNTIKNDSNNKSINNKQNIIPITNDEYYIYEGNTIIGMMKPKKDELKPIQSSPDHDSMYSYEDEYNTYDSNYEPKSVKKLIQDLNIIYSVNTYYKISQKLADHLQKGIDTRNTNNNYYPTDLIKKYKSGQYIIDDTMDKTNKNIETFDNIPGFNIYYYH